MTSAALLHFVEALLWCALLLLSIAGYGAILLRLFSVRRPSISLAAASGVAAVIFLGGCLNLAHAICTPILLGFLLIGVIAGSLLLSFTGSEAEPETRQEPEPSRTVILLLCLLALLIAARLGGSVHDVHYQASDDYNFYLAAPAKMLQLHHYAADPFSERRIMSSIGGNYFLQDLVLVVLPLENLQMADRTLGLLLLAFLAFSLSAEFRLTRIQRAVFALLVLFTPQLQFNLTFVLLPSALFFGLVYLAANRKALAKRPILLALLVGAVIGAIATMKSTYLPHGVLFAGALALFRLKRHGFAAGARTLLFAALGAFIVMAPWMIASHADSGTFFYPLLGPGYHYSAYGLYPPPSGGGIAIVFFKVIPFCLPLLLLLLAEWIWGDRDEQGEAILALSTAAFCAALLVGIATGGDSVRRYNYPCMLPAIVLLYIVFSRRVNALPEAARWLRVQAISVIVIVGAALSIWVNTFTHEFVQVSRGWKSALLDLPIEQPSVHAEYAALQRALPTDSTALATVGNSFLLDYRAHSIDIADYPGAASLPPGWPSHQDGDALAAYLLAHHLRYLVYDYAYFAGFDEGAHRSISNLSLTQWIRSEASIALRSHQQYAELVRTRRRLYDDGNIYILDLATRTDLATPAQATSTGQESNPASHSQMP
jgi:hypothetical protein